MQHTQAFLVGKKIRKIFVVIFQHSVGTLDLIEGVEVFFKLQSGKGPLNIDLGLQVQIVQGRKRRLTSAYLNRCLYAVPVHQNGLFF